MKVLLARATPDGTHILMGKTFVLDEELIFCHESRRESWYRDLNSPYGVDCDVLDWLYSMQVTQVHHYARESNRLYVASVSDIMAYGVHHELPDGPRLYLPAPKWEVFTARKYRCPYINNVKEFPWVGCMTMAAPLTDEADEMADAGTFLDEDDRLETPVLAVAPEAVDISLTTASDVLHDGLTARISEIGRIKQPQQRRAKSRRQFGVPAIVRGMTQVLGVAQ